MLNAKSLEAQYAEAGHDDLKVLVVGAGIAGITTAQLLRKAGRHPVLVERNPDNSHPGYMLALMPMVDSVLDDLDIRNAYRRHSEPFDDYALHTHRGPMLRIDSIGDILDRFGDYRGIARGELLDVLTAHGCAVAFGTTVAAIAESNGGASVTLESGGARHVLDFDLVIVAEGIHSTTRKLLLGDREVEEVDTGWGGWVIWAPADARMQQGEELWGAGFFYGVYPVKDQLGVFLGGDRKDTRQGPEKFVAGIRERLTEIDPRMESCLNAVVTTKDPFFWPLTDCRSPQWVFGHTLLLGDAASGFLPTAGIGAGMAMESAWVLTRMLRRADKANLPALLRAFEMAQRPRVESAQGASRGLAWIMFRQSRLLAILRELTMRFMSVEAALRPIQKLLADKPDPDRIADEVLARQQG